jgi:fermentation-respiration switch protein FrsA (DUF1100 family)
MRGRIATPLLLVAALTPAACGGDTPGHPPAAGPSAVTSSATSPAEAVVIETTDGMRLTGRIYGRGPTGVVLSNMGDNDPAAWDAFAPILADRGYTVLTYSFRYPVRPTAFTRDLAAATVTDLRAAVALMRGRGATRLVLIGASLGGMATAKVAGSVHADAVAIISAPADLPGYGFAVDPGELAALTAPSLFVSSVDDTIVPPAETTSLFDGTPGPKQLQTYPGTAHGVQILASGNGDALRQRLVEFVTAHAPP